MPETPLSADDVIRLLDLAPHPEGGSYRETFRDAAAGPDGRAKQTAIYFLLRGGHDSAWHRVTDAAEVFHFYAGAPCELEVFVGGAVEVRRLGADLAAGERPQAVVPAGIWQRARSLGGWTLIGCTVAPAFVFESFEMAPPGWQPGGDR